MKSRDATRMECLGKIHMILLLLFTGFALCTPKRLTKVTDTLFTGIEDGIIAAFGDFNVDRLTDIFVITNGGKCILSLPFQFGIRRSLHSIDIVDDSHLGVPHL